MRIYSALLKVIKEKHVKAIKNDLTFIIFISFRIKVIKAIQNYGPCINSFIIFLLKLITLPSQTLMESRITVF